MSNDDTCFLLTYWGTIVCEAAGLGLTQRNPLDPSSEDRPAAFFPRGFLLHSVPRPADRFEIVRPEIDGPVKLRRNGLYLCATPDGEVHTSRITPSDWETFMIIPVHDYQAFLFLLSHDWIDSGGSLLRGAGRGILPDFRLRLGTVEFDLRQNLPVALTQDPWVADINSRQRGFRACTLWLDHWKPLRLSLFRPMVFYCVFGKRSFDLLARSVRSLKELGCYQGDLLVLTDASRETVEGHTQHWPAAGLHVMTIAACDTLDFCSARYRIVDWEFAGQYQPLLYVDTDVAFDLDPEPMLVEIALSARMSAQREARHQLGSHAPVGAPLFQEAGVMVGDKEGFNSGVIGIPNIARHGTILAEIYQTIYRYVVAKRNRAAVSHFDQPMANYVGFITDAFDLTIITSYVRWVHSHAYHGGSSPLGLVHFWGAKDKAREIEHYVDNLLGNPERVPDSGSCARTS